MKCLIANLSIKQSSVNNMKFTDIQQIGNSNINNTLSRFSQSYIFVIT